MIWAEDKKLLPTTQSGFRPRRSCHDHIMRICQSVTHGFNKKEKIAALFFYLEKTFVKASHEGLIIKFQKFVMIA